MNRFKIMAAFSLVVFAIQANAQTKEDSLAIRQVALDYIEAQHNVKPEQMKRATHPRMVKRTFWKYKSVDKEYLHELFADRMIYLSESYNRNGDRFTADSKKEVKLLDVAEKTASVKLTTDEWIDYMHILKINGEWKIVNVLWQFNDLSRHE